MKNLKPILFVLVGATLLFSLVPGGCTGQESAPALPAPSVTTTPALTTTQGGSSMEIHPRVTQIDVSNGWASAYLIRGEKIAIVNTGPAQPVEDYIAPALEKLGLTPADIDIILNTNLHGDHIGGNTALQEASNAQINIFAGDADNLENPENYIGSHIIPNVRELLGEGQVEAQRAQFLKNAPQAVTADRRLYDGDIIDLGEGVNLKVLHLPGHTLGEVGYYWEEEGILFAGSSVVGIHGVMGAFPVIDDLDAYEKSLERILALPLKVVAKFHPSESITIPSTFILRDGEIRQYLEEILGSIPIIREAAESVAPGYPEKPFWELYDDFIDQLPYEEWKLRPAIALPRTPFHGGVTLLNLIKKIKE